MRASRIAIGLLAGCAFGALAGSVLADPPGRVGRISYVEGAVSLQAPFEDDWIAADRNYPVASGEALWTDDDGRAEIQVPGVEMWLDNQTELDVVDLDYGATRLSLPQGSVDVRVRRAPEGGVRIGTPAGEVRLDFPGVYRIDVGAQSEDGAYPPVEVTAFEGSAGAPGPEGLVAVDAGEAALIYAGYEPEKVDAQDAAIDDWARDREAREQWDAWRGDGGQDLTGYEDLDRYGQFVDTPEYGQVWFPDDVDPDWAPYREGRWANVQPWGWTWVDDEPWGFTPFHYGRWVRVEGRWGWVRGRQQTRPVYAPALVAFIGLGASGGDRLGWIPLAPGEAYRPDYRMSDDYLRSVNAAALDPDQDRSLRAGEGYGRPAGAFRNAGAAVVVSSAAFARGAPVAKAAVPIDRQVLSTVPAGMSGGLPPPVRAPAEFRGGKPGVFGPGGAIAPPPARLSAMRAALKQAAPGANRPPAIPGAAFAPRMGPPPARPAFVAPAQIRHPEAQGRRPTSAAPGGPRPETGPPAFQGASQAEANRRALEQRQQQQLQEQQQMRLEAQHQAQAEAQRRAEAAAEQRAAQLQQQQQQQEQLRLQAQQRAQAEAEQRAAQLQQQQQQQEQLRLQAEQRAAQLQQQQQQQEQLRLQAQQRAQAEAEQRAAQLQQQEQMRLQAQQRAQAEAEQRAAQQQARAEAEQRAAEQKARAAQPRPDHGKPAADEGRTPPNGPPPN